MKLFAKFLTISSLLFLQISCNIEDDQHEDHKHDYSKTNIKRITIKDAVVNTNAFNKLTKPNKQIKNINGRFINDTINNFSIETESGTYIEKENYHSYTFKVIRENGSEFLLENIVVDKYNDSDYRTFLYQYDITQDELNLINNNQYVDLNNKISIIVLENSSISDYLNTNSKIDYNSMCYVSNTYYVEGSFICPENGHNYSNYTSCPYFDDGTASPTHGNWATDVSLTPCVDAGGINNTDAGEESPSGENGGSGTGGTSTTTPTTTNYQKLREKCFTENNPEVSSWLNQSENADIKNDVMQYLENSVNPDGLQSTQSCYPQENIENIEDFMQNIIDSGLELDFELSINSPTNIDFSDIDTSTPEGQKLQCIYQKLIQSQSFKNLIEDTFGGTQTKLNVKFLTQSGLTNSSGDIVNGQCSPTQTVSGNYYNTITINSDILVNGLNQLSNIQVAKTVLHELIHAYLNIKYIDCNLGTPLPYLSNTELQNLMNSHFTAFCPINSGQNQHDFMFNEMIPLFQSVFSEIRDLLIPPNHITDAENEPIVNAAGNDTGEIFNWNNFYKYLAFDGLHLSNTFIQNIEQNPTEKGKYEGYNYISNQLSKNCN